VTPQFDLVLLLSCGNANYSWRHMKIQLTALLYLIASTWALADLMAIQVEAKKSLVSRKIQIIG